MAMYPVYQSFSLVSIFNDFKLASEVPSPQPPSVTDFLPINFNDNARLLFLMLFIHFNVLLLDCSQSPELIGLVATSMSIYSICTTSDVTLYNIQFVRLLFEYLLQSILSGIFIGTCFSPINFKHLLSKFIAFSEVSLFHRFHVILPSLLL